MTATKKNFVEFLSPGTFCAECSEREIDTWDISAALSIASNIVERYGAKPYGFRFVERVVAGDIDDGFGGKLKVVPREVRRSGMYFIGGTIRTIDDVRRDAKPDERILLSNMECNGWDKIVTTTNGYRWTQPFHDGDVIVGT